MNDKTTRRETKVGSSPHRTILRTAAVFFIVFGAIAILDMALLPAMPRHPAIDVAGFAGEFTQCCIGGRGVGGGSEGAFGDEDTTSPVTAGSASRSETVGSAGGGVFFRNAIQRWSGLNIGMPPTPAIWNASPPGRSIRRNQISPSAPGALRFERNANSFPSGLHRGTDELNAAVVSLAGGADPSTGLIHSSLCRWFSASMVEDRAKTTQRPSGEIAGVAALSSR